MKKSRCLDREYNSHCLRCIWYRVVQMLLE